MTAVRLRGNDHIERARQVYQRHLDGEEIQDLADEYQCHYDVMRRWIKTGRAQTHPPLEDRYAWLQMFTDELASRIPEADDGDVVRLTKQVGEWLGLAHADRQRDAMLAMEAERLNMLREMADRLGVASDPAVVKVLGA